MNGINPNWLPGTATESTTARRTPAAIDRATFNYGRCLPWFRAGKTDAYHMAEKRRAMLAGIVDAMADEIWQLDMALRDVRLADTEAERVRANARLMARVPQ